MTLMALNQRLVAITKGCASRWHTGLLALLACLPLHALAAPAPEPDMAYGAYQRGLYQTAVNLALARLKTNPGDGAAMALIGRVYAEGYAFGPHPRQSAGWYRLAAEKGNTGGEFAWGMDLINGFGTPKNIDAGKAWLTKAADAGNADAQYNLGILTLSHGKGTIKPATFLAAATLFRKAAEGGNADAALSLGLLYQAGRGVPQDDASAAKWFLAAAKGDNAPGMVEYGLAEFKGSGVAKNEPGAARWLLKAANLGNPIAQDRIARLYAVGRALPLDRVAALKWYTLAKAAGEYDDWLAQNLGSTTPQEKAAAGRQLQDYLNP
ncbi:MAG: sel1 repeat family protein [Hyphomicrobiales bacterium]|nr:sel1 repeat family protein [Hyphomicrobiales bacterium]